MADGEIKIGIEIDDSKAKSQADKVGKNIASGVESGLKNASKSANTAANDIDKSFKSASDSAKSSFNDVGSAAKTSFGDVSDAAKSASGDAASAFENVGADAKGSFDDVGDAARDSFGDVPDAAESAASDASSAFNDVGADAKGAFDDVGDAARSSFGDVGDAAKSSASDAVSAFSGVGADVKGSFSDVGDAARNSFAGVPDAARSSASDAVSSFKGLGGDVKGAFSDVASAAKDSFSNIPDSARSAASGVKDAFSGLGDSVKNQGGAILDIFGVQIPAAAAIAGAAITAATAGVGDFLKTSVDVTMGFDSAMSQVAATMGTTTDSIQNLRDFAQEMGATTSFSATEAAQALNYMALAGYDAEKSMNMLPTVLNLAAAGNMQLATASDMVTDAQSALGLSIEETAEMVDKMAMASSKSNTSVEQLGNAFLTVGGTAKNLKGGTTELATSLGILADNGIKGAEGGTTLRNVILSLSAPTDKAADALEGLGIQVFDAEGNMRGLDDIFRQFDDSMSSLSQQEKTQVLNEIFNKVDLKGVTALMANANGEITNMDNALRETGYDFENISSSFQTELGLAGNAATDMAKTISSAMDATEGDFQAVAEIVAEEFNISMEDATMLVEAAANAANDGSDRFAQLSGDIDNAGGAAERMAKEQLNNLAGDLKLMESAIEGVHIAVGGMLTPALREMASGASEAFGTMKEQLLDGDIAGAAETFGNMVMGIAQEVIKHIPDMLDAGLKFIGGFLDGIAQQMPFTIPAIVEMLTGLVTTIIDNIPLFIQAAFELTMGLALGLIQALPQLVAAIPQIIMALVNAIIELGPAILQAFIDIFTQVGESLSSEGFEGILSAVLTFGADLASAAMEVGGQFVEGFIPFIAELPGNVANFLGDIINNVGSWIGEMAAGAADAGSQFITNAINFITQLPGKIASFLSNIISNVGQWVGNMAQNAIQAGQQFLTNVVNFITQLPGKIANFLSNIISNVGQWVSNMAQNATKAGTDFLNNVVNFITQLPGKIAGFLSNIISNVVSFAADMGAKALQAGQQFFTNIVNKVQEIPGKMLSIGKNIVTGIWNGISGAAGWLMSQISGFASNVISGIAGFFGIHSPSTIMRDLIGKNLAKGIVVGFEIEDPLEQIEGTLQSGMMSLQLGAMQSAVAAGGTTTTNNMTNNFYGEINSPDVITRNLRMQQRYGLAGSF